MESMREEIKPCPFCGSDNVDVLPHDNGIGCLDCHVFMPRVASTEVGRSHGGLEMWNRRA